jgi:gliding motility-associated-like protein
MKYLLLLILTFSLVFESLATGGCTGTVIPCSDANPFCTTNTYNFPNETSTCTPSGPNYGCLSSTPNPVWYYMEVDVSGTFQITLSQTTGTNGTGTGLDVDFALYGPFLNLTSGCSSVNGGIAPIQCSYSGSATETIGIGLPGGIPSTTPAAAVAGQVYIVLITNYDSGSGYISFNQTGGTGVADCAIVSPCDISSVTATPSTCNAGNTYSVSGSVTFVSAPTTGTLTVTCSGGGTQVFSAPFTSPLAYTISNVAANGAASTITATFSDDNTCTNTVNYTAPSTPTVNAGSDQSVCAGVNVTLAGSGASTYTWDNGVTDNVSFAPAATLTYTVTGTSVSGCTGTDQVVVTINSVPTVNAGADQSACVGSSVTLNGTGASTYSWDNGVTNGVAFVAPTTLTTYTVTGTTLAGCTGTDQVVVTVNAIPSVSAGTYTSVCSDAADISLAGTPSGGTFSGTGVTGTNFDPSAGTQTITYSYTDGNGCSNSANTTITINTLPVVSAGTYLDQCANAPLVTLVGSPVGGTFSGAGVASGQFNPAVGTSSITYNYTDGNSCSNSASTVINVNPVPLVSGGSYLNVCSNAGIVALAGTPAGGTFTGTGVTGSNFDPAVGTQSLTYDYTDGQGCSNSTTTTITVVNPAAINAGTYSPVCIDAVNVALVGSPAGGTFSGTGVTSNSFDPSVGTQLITYNYTDPAGCSGSGTTTITVNPLPVVDAGVYAAVCSNGSTVALAGTPAGGTFTGSGVTGSVFNPASGTQTITYSYMNGNGCTNSDVATITVNPAPVVNAGSYSPVCVNGTPVNIVGTPAGGTFSGTGVTANTFNPASGTQTITYTYTSAQNCTNSSTSTIQVNNLPTINAGTDFTICAGSSVTLNGNGGTSYSWNNGGVNGQAFTPSTGSTVYTVTGTDANGCVNTDNVTVNVFTYPNAYASADVTTGNPGLVVNFDNFSTNATSYNWDFGNGASANVSNLNSQTATYGSVGSYLMVLTSSNGICSDTAMIQIDILPYPSPEIHIPNVFTPNGDNANDEFFILTNNASALEVVILNRWGNVVHEINTIDGVWDGDVNGKQADDGVYFFKYVVTGLNNEEIIGHGNITLIRK